MSEPASISLFGFFVSAASAFGKLLSYFRNVHHQTTDAVATYFDQIAACLREVAERIENGQPPRDTCRRLAVFAAELQDILGRDGYLTATGDASIDETRLRLAGEIERVRNIWAARLTDNDLDLGVNKLTRNLAMNATNHEFRGAPWRIAGKGDLTASPPSPLSQSESTVNRFEKQITCELDARMDTRKNSSVQEIWDAAGEFAALADTLRARR
jgi:hypothetical protein